MADALDEYYRNAATTEDRIYIEILRGKGHAYEPRIVRRSIAARDCAPTSNPALTIAPKWNREYLHEMIRRSAKDTELRLQTTCFVSPVTMRETVSYLLQKGVHVRILMADPGCGVFRARYRLHKGRQRYDMRQEAESQRQTLRDLADQHPEGALQCKVCDLMPFGFFVQGESVDDGRSMMIGLMPATNAYTSGPMIVIRPTETHLWALFEETWQSSWNSPIDPERGS